MSDPLFDGTDDPELAALEQQLGAFKHDAAMGALPPRPARSRRWLTPLTGTLLGTAVAAAAVAYVWFGHHSTPCTGGHGFAFELSAGAATCGGAAASRGTLPVGAWFETERDAVADVKVADIGDLTVYGDSKLRLVASDPTKHHLELARGHVSAHVTAPPRLFVVDTPTATAVDLGCAYDLTVAPNGGTHLRVTLGAVSLEGKDGITYVPSGHEVDLLPGHHAGLPVPLAAGPELRAAVARFDAGAPNALAEVLEAAGRHDRLTLWNLVARTHDARAIDRLAEFAPLPDPAMRAKLLAGDADALDIWLDVFVDRGDQAHDKRR